nr:sugar transferase [Kineococcus rhizosphaerae]
MLALVLVTSANTISLLLRRNSKSKRSFPYNLKQHDSQGNNRRILKVADALAAPYQSLRRHATGAIFYPTQGWASSLQSTLLSRRHAREREQVAGRLQPALRTSSLTNYPKKSQPPAWVYAYIQRAVAIDATVAALASFTAFYLRFHAEPADLSTRSGLMNILWAALFPITWVAAMGLSKNYETRSVGVDLKEYNRVARSALLVLTTTAVTSWLFHFDFSPGLAAWGIFLVVILNLFGRYTQRQDLYARRMRGEASQTVVAVGHRAAVAGMARQLHRASYHGMRIVGACVPGGPGSAADDAELRELGIPVIGSLDDVRHAVTTVDADIVAVTASPELEGPGLRRLSWELEATRAELVIAPGLIDVFGSRISTYPVSELSLLQIDHPDLQGSRRLAKGAFDRLSASLALVVLSPLFLALAVAIKLDSKGPVFFRQQRIGKDGNSFPMMKFRSMVADAEEILLQLRDLTDGNGVLFKMKVDPRITRIGRVLRRYSLDELPQLINIVRGEMSLVGPRPPLQKEVDEYGFDMRRRLLVKPGLTGLWQINGRSDLDWDESVRLDVRYVDNWSLAFDFMILWRTAGIVLRGRGAY